MFATIAKSCAEPRKGAANAGEATKNKPMTANAEAEAEADIDWPEWLLRVLLALLELYSILIALL